MSDDLRARIEAALAPHTHNGCVVDAELGDVLDAVMVVFNAWINKCHHCNRPADDPHPMTCVNYVGAVEHGEPTVRLLGNGVAQCRCTCGWFWYDDDQTDTCPNVAETWRGPKAEDAP